MSGSQMNKNFRSRAMVHHYVNLVSLNYHRKSYDNGQNYYVDSVSLSIVLNALKIPHKRISGTGFFRDIKGLKKTYYLLPFNFESELQGEVLPFLEKADIDSYISQMVKRLELSDFDRVIIGISSPKQDIFGRSLAQVFTGDIFCLGAAIQYRNSKLLDIADVVGLTWFLMLVRSPYRTMHKIFKTITELIIIIASKNYRDDIKKMNFQN